MTTHSTVLCRFVSEDPTNAEVSTSSKASLIENQAIQKEDKILSKEAVQLKKEAAQLRKASRIEDMSIVADDKRLAKEAAQLKKAIREDVTNNAAQFKKDQPAKNKRQKQYEDQSPDAAAPPQMGTVWHQLPPNHFQNPVDPEKMPLDGQFCEAAWMTVKKANDGAGIYIKTRVPSVDVRQVEWVHILRWTLTAQSVSYIKNSLLSSNRWNVSSRQEETLSVAAPNAAAIIEQAPEQSLFDDRDKIADSASDEDE